MSYTYLQEAGEESLAECFSDIPAYVLSRLNLTRAKSSCSGSETESCHDSQSGTTSKLLTGDLGAGLLMSSAEDSHAKISVQQAEVQGLTANDLDCGPKCEGSFARYHLATSSWKTRQCLLVGGLAEYSEIWPRWGMMRDGECFRLETLEHDTSVKGFGFSLPTMGKCEFKGSSRRRYLGSLHFRGAKMSEGLRICETDQSYTHPGFAEEVMGWPIMWTELAPLEMDKFQQWRDSHGKC